MPANGKSLSGRHDLAPTSRLFGQPGLPDDPEAGHMNILVTGGAGFIGAALGRRLLELGHQVFAVDNLNAFYDTALKNARLELLFPFESFRFEKIDIADRERLLQLFCDHRFDVVVNLAAQAGVRYSIDHPDRYIDANLVGFGNVLEGCRHSGVGHLVYASSSSVYGGNATLPYHEDHPAEHPVSLYAATKKANELMAHAYSHLFGLPATALRFFTVYGPWGRPDMAFFKFCGMILSGESIPVYNHGNLARDFTYIDDAVDAVVRVIGMPAAPDPEFDPADPIPSTSDAPHCIYNIGNGNRVNLMDYIHALEEALNMKAKYTMLPMQAGDVAATHADIGRLSQDLDYRPGTGFREGLVRFVEWYRDYYGR